ncbi:DNA gyrase inhibitor YacG [Vulgatibacter sp.]|uniref:DNA gyrase inhibitor YacG n=1 Tax=Vulgatibacter sp. TaxID=1971226 RepID=UPI00356773AC
MSELRCVICSKPVERRPVNPYYPFCSHRCRLVDLGKWIGEEYKVPAQPGELDEEALAVLEGESGDTEH